MTGPLLLLALLATPPLAPTAAEALMAEIEAAVRLPAGARPLEAYARHYAVGAEGDIIAAYVVPLGPTGPDETCEDLGADLTARAVPCPEPASGTLAAGQRRWLDDYRDLPNIFDGGCGVIRLSIDRHTRKPTYIACNGRG
ncbi:hypothetical protein [Sphingosinicella sp. BN140058]|uniref:hypothetical protein n=1 Tax=Sphingosinicella sp. BN140058 TaxID=1892855 RepID=UPI0010120474|nr:hypothetical protein [Sphingosinicella sp. BN140058]QAY77798.1 hypothetical protein ETR14_15700 [Sphingosinicella sp. BN140058]